MDPICGMETDDAGNQECAHCGGMGEVTGEYPGTTCPACHGSGERREAMFDEQPDGDPHGECVEEIHRLGKEVSELRAANNQWFALIMEIGRRVGCLASSFPDANNHILGKLPAVESRAGALGRIADALCEYVEDDAADSARYRWLRHNSGYSIRCSLFGEVGMHEHKDADLDALIDAQMTPNVKSTAPLLHNLPD